MEERLLLEGQDVRITSARFVAGPTTHAIRTINSVSLYGEYPSPAGPTTLIVIGALVGVFGLLSVVPPEARRQGGVGCAVMFAFIGGMLALGGWMTLRSQRPKFVVTIGTSSGQSWAYRTTDLAFARQVEAALNEAITMATPLAGQVATADPGNLVPPPQAPRP